VTAGQPKEKSKMPGIIVGIDGSVHSRHALDWAIREAAVRKVPLTVVTVHQAVAQYWGGPAVSYVGVEDQTVEAREMAEKETRAALDEADLGTGCPSLTVKSVTGLPAEALLEAAADADMLVVGSRGAGGFRRLLMGSVSTQVTHHAHCPVVVIPADNT
jgi:nucleotide-binding universal stress UspA family protein